MLELRVFRNGSEVVWRRKLNEFSSSFRCLFEVITSCPLHNELEYPVYNEATFSASLLINCKSRTGTYKKAEQSNSNCWC